MLLYIASSQSHAEPNTFTVKPLPRFREFACPESLKPIHAVPVFFLQPPPLWLKSSDSTDVAIIEHYPKQLVCPLVSQYHIFANPGDILRHTAAVVAAFEPLRIVESHPRREPQPSEITLDSVLTALDLALERALQVNPHLARGRSRFRPRRGTRLWQLRAILKRRA